MKVISQVTVHFMPRETLFKCQMVERSRTGGLVDQNHYKGTRTAQEKIPREDKVFPSTGKVALSIKLSRLRKGYFSKLFQRIG